MNSIFSNIQTTNTILGIKNQLCKQLDIPIADIDLSYTLNSKYGVFNGKPLDSFPKLAYFGIGIGGIPDTVDGKSPTTPYKPSCDNMDLYIPIPVRMFPSLTVPQSFTNNASDYALKTTTTIDGVEYTQYWLKKINFDIKDSASVDIILTDENGYESVYAQSEDRLIPSAEVTTNLTVYNSIIVSVQGSCVISGSEILEAITYLYGGDRSKAMISEVGFYTGVSSPTDPYVLAAQLAIHRCMSAIDMSNSGTSLDMPIILSNGSSVITNASLPDPTQ